MDPDIILFVGVLVFAAAFPLLVGSFSAGQSPRGALAFLFVGGTLIVAAMSLTPSGYEIEEIPSVMLNVVRQAFN